MPFKHIEDAETRLRLGEAFDLVCDRLKLKSTDPLTGEVAIKLIALSADGDHDPVSLSSRVLEALDGHSQRRA